MKNKNGKVFRKIDNTSNKIQLVTKEYDKNINYYEFLRKNKEQGLNQIIITSEIMINIIQHYVIEREFEILDINFIVEDFDLKSEVTSYIMQTKRKPEKIIYLLQHLNFLTQDESIDIKEIVIKGYTQKLEKSFRLNLKVNGIFTIRTEVYDIESEYLKEQLQIFFNKEIL